MTPAAGRSVEGVALVTGGTGGLGRAVVAELLDAGAQVVVPWVAERERDAVSSELGERDELHLVEANLLEGGAAEAVDAAAGAGELRSVVNLVGGFAAGDRIHEEPPETLDEDARPEPDHGGQHLARRAAEDAGGRRRLDRLRRDEGRLRAFQRRGRLRDLEGCGAGARPRPPRRVPRRRRPRERDRPQRDRHPRQPESMPDADFDKWVEPAEIARVVRFLCSADSSPISGDEIPVYGKLMAEEVAERKKASRPSASRTSCSPRSSAASCRGSRESSRAGSCPTT